jgi:hypothetical protein
LICKHKLTDVNFLSCEELGVPRGSFAQMPTPVQIGDIIRVFFSSRDIESRSHIYFIDLDSKTLRKVGQLGKPGIELGTYGAFDEDGVMPSSLIQVGGEWLFYYIGWSRPRSTPYSLAIGLAIGSSLDTFIKYSKGPLIDKSVSNPFFATTPSVSYDGRQYEMYYSKGYDWQEYEEKLESKYLISRATSEDGKTWSQFKDVDLPGSSGSCFARPVTFDDHIVYSSRPTIDFRTRNRGYRLRIGRIPDSESFQECGLIWEKNEKAQKDAAYAKFIRIDDKEYLFYNADSFGRNGFNIASHEKICLE